MKNCDKDCIANLNGKCCADECKGQIIMLTHWKKKNYNLTKEQLKKFYQVLIKYHGEDYVDKNDYSDEED